SNLKVFTIKSRKLTHATLARFVPLPYSILGGPTMPRKAEGPRYFKSRGAYYVQIDKTQHILARGPEGDPAVLEEAWARFRELTSVTSAQTAGDRSTVHGIMSLYLIWYKDHRQPESYEFRRKLMSAFVKHCGEITVKDLRTHHVEAFLAAMREFRR